MQLTDVIALSTAAEELGVAASTLRHQAQAGRIQAIVVGKTWITTRQEVDRYRREHLGRVGRPSMEHRPGNLLEHVDVGRPTANIFDEKPSVEPDNLLTKGRVDPIRRR